MSAPSLNSTSQSTTDVSTQEIPASLHESNSTQTLRESDGAELPDSIYPSSPSRTRRYDLNRTIQDVDPECPNVKPLSLCFANESLPIGWQRHVHPEGLPYFCRSPSADCPMKILTEEWLFEPDTAHKIEDYIQTILNAISRDNVVIPSMSDLVVELYPGTNKCGYYLVHHPTRSIYWLEEVNPGAQCTQVGEIRGKVSGYQIETCLEVEYWNYWASFPNVQSLTTEVHDYVVDALASAMTDQISSRDSTITYPYETLRDMLNIVQGVRTCKTSTWYIGRFMQNIVGDRFRNYYGAWNARLNREQAVLPEPDTRSKFLGFFSPLLFFIPHAQLARVSPLAIDGCVIVMHWKRLFKELQDEWDQTMTLATIMLAANCAFLAIPIFGEKGTEPDPHSSPEQVASYLSLAASLFGLILSMVMSRQHKAGGPNTVYEILDYVFDLKKSRHRLEHLVLIWSLPHALVLWSVVAFLLAFLVMCFAGTHTVTKIVVAVSAGLLTSLVFYYIIRFGSGKKLRQLWSKRIFQEFGKIKELVSKIPSRRRRQEEETASQTGVEQV